MPAILQTAHPCPSECPLTCYSSIPGRVKPASCPCGVRNFGIRLVSAAHLLDQVPSSPAESSCVRSPAANADARHGGASYRDLGLPSRSRSEATGQARVSAKHKKSSLSGHYSPLRPRIPGQRRHVAEPHLTLRPASQLPRPGGGRAPQRGRPPRARPLPSAANGPQASSRAEPAWPRPPGYRPDRQRRQAGTVIPPTRPILPMSEWSLSGRRTV